MATGAVIARILTQYSDKGSKAAAKDIQKMGKRFDDFSKRAVRSFGIAAAASAAFAVKLGVDAVKGAAADERQQTLLAGAIRNTTNATEAAIAANSKFLDSLELQVAIDNEQLMPALQRLVTSTGDLSQAQALLSLSTDVAAASGKDLASVSAALSKAVNGNFGALTKLGLPLDANAVKTKDLSKLLVELSRISAGQAAAAADTFQGRLTTLGLAVNQIKDKFGEALIPTLVVFTNYLTSKIIPNLDYFAFVFQDKIRVAVDSSVAAIKEVATAFKNIYNAVKAINDVLPLGIAGWIQLGVALAALTKITVAYNIALKILGFVTLVSNKAALQAVKVDMAGAAAKGAQAVGAQRLFFALASATAGVVAYTKATFASTKASLAAGTSTGFFNLNLAGMKAGLVAVTTLVKTQTIAMIALAKSTLAANGALLTLKATLLTGLAFLKKYAKQIVLVLAAFEAIDWIINKFTKSSIKLSEAANAAAYEWYKVDNQLGEFKGVTSMDQALAAYKKTQEKSITKTKEQIELEKLLASINAKNSAADKKAADQAAKAAALKKRIEDKYKVKITDPGEYEQIQLTAVEKLLAKQKESDKTLSERVKLRKEELALFEALSKNAQRYTDLLAALADEKLSNQEIELLAKKWGLTVDAAKSYIYTIFAIKDEKVSEDEVEKLAEAWGITKAQAGQYLDFFAALNDGKLSDTEIANLMTKWGLTKDEAQKYADFVSKIGDGKLDNKEIDALKSKWGLTTEQVVEYIKKIGGKVDASGTILSAGDIAALGWTNALNALNAYLAALKTSSGGIPVTTGTTSKTGTTTTTTATSVAEAVSAISTATTTKAINAAVADATKAGVSASEIANSMVTGLLNQGVSTQNALSSARYTGQAIAAQQREEQLAAAAVAREKLLSDFKAKEIADARNDAAASVDYDERFRFQGSSTLDTSKSLMASGMNSSTAANITINVAGSVTTENDLVQTVRNGLLAGQTNGQSLTLQAI